MNIVDIIIIIFIVLMGIMGSKRGVFKEVALCIGTILIFYIAYKFKDPIGNFLLLKLPLFDFPNLFKGAIVLNILVYQLLAFVLVLSVLLIAFQIILSITGLFEKLLRITVIFGIFSKILGFIFGLIEGYIIAFVILFFLTQPAFSFDLFMNSKYANKILTSSPVLTNITGDTVELMTDIYNLKDEKDSNTLNYKILDMMLDKNVVSYETANELYESEKLKFEGVEELLSKYKN